MTPPHEPRGVALICDAQGRVLRVIRDELDLNERIAPGRLLPGVVDKVSTTKALAFLDEIRTHGAAFNWTLNCPIDGELVPLHFAGCAGDEGLAVVAARSRSDIIKLYDELMKINNEQINALRQALKEQTERARDLRDQDIGLYDELSRLNNDLANAQRELAKKNAELARLNQLKNQFLGIASHDLRTPLGVILSYSEFLLGELGPELRGEYLEFLNVIQSSTEFMLSLVNNLLDVSRIETGRLDLELWPTDILALVQRNVELNGMLAGKKQITLELVDEAPIAPMEVDGPRIEQVLNNLIGNAIKFSHPGTTIRVELAQNEESATISVCDQGEGIPAGELEKLFQPFQKTSTRSTQGEQGAGLGLAIVRKIVEEHGGRIAVRSEAGRGSTFTVTLPMRRGSAVGGGTG
jgi:signal transduction histidine kinase